MAIKASAAEIAELVAKTGATVGPSFDDLMANERAAYLEKIAQPVSGPEARAYLARPDVHLHKCEKCKTVWSHREGPEHGVKEHCCPGCGWKTELVHREKTKLPPISEKAFQQQVIDLAKLRGWKVAHFRTVRIQRPDGSIFYQTPVQADGKGFPDLFMVRGERAIAAELKRSSKEEVTTEQHEWLLAMAEAGIEAATWTPECWELIEEVLK